MKLTFYTLKSSKQLKLDNSNCSLNDIAMKLIEETRETTEALHHYKHNTDVEHLRQVVLECFDTIQICILILWRARKESIKLKETGFIQRCNAEHILKLNRRGWQQGSRIDVDVE